MIGLVLALFIFDIIMCLAIEWETIKGVLVMIKEKIVEIIIKLKTKEKEPKERDRESFLHDSKNTFENYQEVDYKNNFNNINNNVKKDNVNDNNNNKNFL